MKLIKPEKKELFLNVAITPSMDKKIREFAEKYEVNKSEAARQILEFFFTENFENPEAVIPKNEANFGNFGMQS